jgi:hypothetical protein
MAVIDWITDKAQIGFNTGSGTTSHSDTLWAIEKDISQHILSVCSWPDDGGTLVSIYYQSSRWYNG